MTKKEKIAKQLMTKAFELCPEAFGHDKTSAKDWANGVVEYFPNTVLGEGFLEYFSPEDLEAEIEDENNMVTFIWNSYGHRLPIDDWKIKQ